MEGFRSPLVLITHRLAYLAAAFILVATDIHLLQPSGALLVPELIRDGRTMAVISITEILNRLCVSRRVLEKHFRKEVGISIYQYILDYRTSCFAEKLLTSDLPIMDIAFELGYEDYINLTKSFKRIYQMTPTQYRKLL